MAEWHTLQEGIRYREHPTRKHGAKKDRYFVFRHRANGKRIEEVVGWASQGWTEKAVKEEFALLQRNKRLGTPPYTLKARREEEAAKEAEAEKKKQKKERENVTVSAFFSDHYLPTVEGDRKNKNTPRNEISFFKNWIEPAIGKKPIRKIAPMDLERIKSKMRAAKRSPRTAEYVLSVTRQIFNEAIEQGFYEGKNPARGGKRSPVKRQAYDNRRERPLTPDEADQLLEALATRSTDLHDMALLSLNTGMRAGEIFSLTWGCVDLAGGTILVLDGKNDENRYAYLNDKTRQMLTDRQPGKPSELVFTSKSGGKIEAMSKTFKRTVDQLGFNADVDDRRRRVVFHSLRHTFASWLVQNGVDIFRVQKLMGHKDIKLTLRYSHLGSKDLREAVDALAG